MSHTFNSLKQQRGGALITALSILLVMTVLGISAMSTSALQERMAGNARDAEVAFEAAEAALRAAETYLTVTPAATITATFNANTAGYYQAGATEQWMTEANWLTAVIANYPLAVSRQPRFIIQQVNATGGPASVAASLEPISYNNNPPALAGTAGIYQITARGFGLSANSRVMLQSYVGI